MRTSGLDGEKGVFVVDAPDGDRLDVGGADQSLRVAEMVFPDLAAWRGILWRLSIPARTAVEIAARAQASNMDFQSALLASGLVGRDELYHAAADDLGLRFIERIDPSRLILGETDSLMLLRRRSCHLTVKLEGSGGLVLFLTAPEPLEPAFLRDQLRKRPGLPERLCLVDPEVLRAEVLRRARPALEDIAVNGLSRRFPHLSARTVASAWQGIVIGIAVMMLPFGLLVAPARTFLVLHVLATLFFFACVALRFAAAVSARPTRLPPPLAMPAGDIPVYTVLVALYREGDILPDLVAALDRLVWPRDRLEVRLVCEADDALTLDAIRSLSLPAHIEVVEVPPGLPRTKPKALAYALPTTGGEFVALYDAEDEPHPMQLVEAWKRFRAAGADLASVQAPLEISNGREGVIPRSFAFEYAALFRGLLPWLARHDLMLPLGGTSNHFRGLM